MDSFFDLWRKIKPSLHEELGDTAYNVWIETIVPVELNSQDAIFKVPSGIHRDVVDTRFSETIGQQIKELTGLSVTVRFVVEDELSTLVKNDFDVNYEYTFDTFIVGSSNRFAHAAALAVAQNPGGAYNPLFIYGQSGLGKTHLLYAIKAEALKKNPLLNIVYIKGDQFTNELIEAISKGQQVQFRQKYRYVDILLMDDIQFIGGKTSTEEEFFHTFNTLHQEHKQIVLTSDRPPREIKTLEERLRSRFESGLLADVHHQAQGEAV